MSSKEAREELVDAMAESTRVILSRTPGTDLKSFGEVFEQWAPWNSKLFQQVHEREWSTSGRVNIGIYCMVNVGGDQDMDIPHCSVQVKPSKAVVEYIHGNMIHVDYDKIHFNVILFPKDGEAHIYACYGLIIGNRLIAIVNWDTVPKMWETEEPTKELPVDASGRFTDEELAKLPARHRKAILHLRGINDDMAAIAAYPEGKIDGIDT